MNLYLFDQSNKLNDHLERFKKLPVIPYEKGTLVEKTTSIEIRSNLSLSALNMGFLFDYDIFPRQAMSHLTQWNSEHRNIRVGDTIVRHVFVTPKNKRGVSYTHLTLPAADRPKLSVLCVFSRVALCCVRVIEFDS